MTRKKDEEKKKNWDKEKRREKRKKKKERFTDILGTLLVKETENKDSDEHVYKKAVFTIFLFFKSESKREFGASASGCGC